MATYTISPVNFDNIITVDGFVEPVQSTTLACPRDVDGVVIYLIEDGTYVNVGDTVCIIEDANIQTWHDNSLIDLENAEANLNKVRAELDMQYALLEAQVKNNEAETQIAQLDSLQLEYSTRNQRRIKELELEKVTIEKAKYEKKLKSLELIQQSELKKLELEIQRLANQVELTRSRLNDLIVKSPMKGLATRAVYPVTWSKLEVGDPVWNNMPLVIIPDLTAMKVKIMAAESDYKSMNVNDSISYIFDAMPDNVAWGKIVKKAPFGQPLKKDSKVKFFEIEATIDSTLVMPEPGFSAKCNVILNQIKDTIVVPQVAVFDEDSIKVVYVKKEKGYEKRQVLTGAVSSSEVVVTAGLDVNEVVALTKPVSSQVKNKKLLPDSISAGSNSK